MATLAELKARQRQKAGNVLASNSEAQGEAIPAAPDPLVLYAVRELGAVCTTGEGTGNPAGCPFEAQAEILLAQVEDTLAWRRRWAALAEAAGWPCYGSTWCEWAEVHR